MTTEHVALLDLGKSNLRLEIRGGDGPLVHAEPVRGWLGDPISRQVLLEQVASLGTSVGGLPPVTAVSAAVAGFAAADEPTRAAVAAALRSSFACAKRVAVVSDVDAAHAGAFGGEAGVLLVAGTGAVALGVDTDGTRHQVDGRGPLLGDEGSGGWIGREGCLAAVLAADGRGPATVLDWRSRQRYGVPPDKLQSHIDASTNPAREFGRFAPDVLDAWQDGDVEATRIADAAAARLAASAAIALRQMPAACRRLVMVGGLSQHPPFRAAVIAQIAAEMPDTAFPAARGTPMDGAALLLRA